MTREELFRSPAYWTAGLQMELYRQIVEFMKNNHMNKTQLADYLGCSKGYVTQLLNGDFNHKLSKFVELSLAIGKVPEISFSDMDEYILSDEKEYVLQMSVNNESEGPTDLNDFNNYLSIAA